jgi:dihydropteroate synthase
MKGTPQTMQKLTNYDNIVDDIFNFFQDKTTQLKQRGVSNIIIDLGFGFGKTINQNYKLLNKMSEFQEIGLPILAGISRKSMVYKALDLDPKQALNGTTALNMLCLTNGASILRVHDVKQAMECIKLFNFAQNNK